MQRTFVNDLVQTLKDEILAGQMEVIASCIEKDIPLIVIEYDGEGRTLDTLQIQIKKVPRTEKITKKQDDAFYNPKLHKILKKFGVKKLVVMGINASYCVRQTAQSALRLGYEVITADNLIADGEYRPDRIAKKAWNQWYKKNCTLYENPISLG